MQPWQFHRVFLDSEVQSSDSATRKLTLPLSNILHTLLVKVECTNGSTSAIDQDLDAVIDEIKSVANGSDVLYHLTPAEIRRWNLWLTSRSITEKRDEQASIVQSAMFPIMFGREMFDPHYWLPCSRFSDLELQIKFSPTIAATSFATGTTTITVLGLMSMGGEPGDYWGTLATRTIKSFTTVASGEETTLLPRGNIYRQLMAYAYEEGIAFGANLTNVKFDLNSDERVMYDVNMYDLQEWNYLDKGIDPVLHYIAFGSNDDTLATKIDPVASVACCVAKAVDATNDITYQRIIDAIAGDQLTIDGSTATIAAGSEVLAADTADAAMYIDVKGRGLPHAVVLDFAKNGEGQLLNSSEYDQVRLTLEQGNAGAAARISLQEVRNF